MRLSLGHRKKLVASIPTERGQYSLYPVRQQFDQLKAQIAAGWQIEHKPDGTHADITPDSVLSSNYKFPATQVPSTDANTLDDYEERTWTPVIGGEGGQSGQAYATQRGRAIKIGSLVWAGFYAELSTEGTITGNLTISGFPWAAIDTTQRIAIGSVTGEALATNWVSFSLEMVAGATYAVVRGRSAAAASDSSLTATDVGNTSLIKGSIIYMASA